MNTTRSAALRAKPISWVTTIIVMPSCARPTMTSSTSLIISGSSARGRLVEQHDLRLHRERAGDRHALLLAAGELGGQLVRLVRDADALEQLHRPSLGSRFFSLRTLIGPSVTFSSIVLCANRLNDWNTMPTSARSSASPLPSSGSSLPSMRDGAAVDRLEPVDRPAECRLARAARADDDDDLAACRP